MAKNVHESGYRFGGNISRQGRDTAVLPVLEKRFMWFSKQTGLFVEVTREKPEAKRGPLGGVVFVATVRGGSADQTGPHLKQRDSDSKLGKNKARKATRAGRRLGEQWLANTSDSQIRAIIKDRQPIVHGGRR